MEKFKGEKISNKNVRSVWRSLRPIKKMPKIEAFLLDHDEFHRMYNLALKSIEDTGFDPLEGRFQEYGILEGEHIADGFVAHYKDGSPVIFIDRTSITPLHDILKHELEHVYNNDIEIIRKKRGK